MLLQKLPSRSGVSEGTADSLLLLDVVRAVLARLGGQRWIVRPTDTWCYVTAPGNISRKHGWKLHISATPLSAPLVLARAAEILIRHGCTFKFATDIPRMAQLVGIWYDRGGGGKFITIYPRDDEQFRLLAEALHEGTEGLPGPQILSDKPFQHGSLVHFRYGEFNGDKRFTDDGVFISQMEGPDGSLVSDERKAWFSPPAWAKPPFPGQPVQAGEAPESVLLNGRFRVRGAIRHANKGGVYRAVDERDGSEVIVKQARAHVGAGLDGADVRDRLREEARMLKVLAPLKVAPTKVALFEEDSHLFLVEEAIPGEPLDAWAAENRGELSQNDLVGMGRRLVQLMEQVHRADLVIRDLKPQNIMVTPSRDLLLIDVEFVAERGRRRSPAFTQGFCAPEVAEAGRHSGPVPDPSADCFSLGVTLFCMATGLQPAWVSGQPGSLRSRPERELLLAHIRKDYPHLAPFHELILGLTESDPEERWSLDQARKFLADIPGREASPAPAAPLARSGSLDRLLEDGITHLQRSMTPHETALWKMRPRPSGEEADTCNAWNGAAGPLRVLTHAARVRHSESLRASVAQATTWISERLFNIPRLLPGLSFGRAGTAWALHDAATLIGDEAIAARAIDLAKRLPVVWPSPDITHGLSGAGMAHLYLWEATSDDELLHRALTCAEAVLGATQRRSEHWSWPTSPQADSNLAGANNDGYAHGTAGVGAFLLAAAQACGEDPRYRTLQQRCWEAAHGAARTLVRAARAEGGGITRLGGVGRDIHGGNGQWCNGPAGMGGFLIRMWAATGEQRYADLAEQCVSTSLSSSWSLIPGACCGLAGVGHFLLDMSELTDQEDYHAQAEHLAGILHAQHIVEGGLWLPSRDSWSDYATGVSGSLGFLIRLRHGGPSPWTPQLRERAVIAGHGQTD
ncbi:class IV lanthionine synthetase LanL [Streptomyces sp. NPDC002285]